MTPFEGEVFDERGDFLGTAWGYYALSTRLPDVDPSEPIGGLASRFEGIHIDYPGYYAVIIDGVTYAIRFRKLHEGGYRECLILGVISE